MQTTLKTSFSEQPSGAQDVDLTSLLQAWTSGDKAALDKILPVVSEDLRRRASQHLRRERVGHTLQPTALVNEAYLRLVRQNRIQWQNRAQFLAVASKLMRRILIDHARHHAAAKRGDAALRITLTAVDVAAVPERDTNFLTLHRALEKLAEVAPRVQRVVELRYFGGLTIRETAEVLRVSGATVRHDWAFAKAFLYRELGGEES